MKRNSFNFILSILALFIIFSFYSQVISVIEQFSSNDPSNITIVIDAGHGNFDPGKVGINGALEKDINLSIAYKVKNLLEINNINVIMTRTTDNCLCKKTDRNKKQIDMRQRIKIINTSGALCAISIHQNSFTGESSKGAQVFYYQNSKEGKLLAEVLQNKIKSYINDGNHREAKMDGTYYLLRNTHCPAVIVECGFLSNRQEADLLCEDSYQDKMAWAICSGVMEYINEAYKTPI